MSVMILDDFLAGGKPAAEQNVQTCAFQAPAERCEIANVGDEQPAGDILDFALCSLRHHGFVFV